MRYAGGGEANGDTEGPLFGVGGNSSCTFGERSGWVTAKGGTVTPGRSVTLLIWGFQPTEVSDSAGSNTALLRGESLSVASAKETKAGFSLTPYI